MDVDSNSNSTTRKGRGRGFGTGAQRPQPNRNRSAPYSQRTSSSLPEGKWQHDLFGPKSSVYNPQLGRPSVQADVSPSLRPFGAATPALTRTVSDSAAQRATPQAHQGAPPTAPKADLLQRLGIKGSSSEAQDRQRRDEERRARLEQQKAEKARGDAARKEAAARRKAEEDRERQLQIAQQEDKGFVVQVEGLVYGTSAEDVQTAFGAYGETSFCFIVNEQSAREGDALIARLTFKIYDDAVTACSKLNGAIADGRPLKVEQVSRTPIPPPIAAVLGAAPAAARNGGGAIPTGPRADRKTVAAPVAPAPASRTMYADEVEAVDPRYAPAVIDISGDDVEMDVASSGASTPQIPTGPRRGVSGRGRNGARGGGAHRGGSLFAPAPQQQQQAKPTSLLGRLGQAPSQAGAQGGRRQDGRGAGKSAAPVPGSLLARLG